MTQPARATSTKEAVAASTAVLLDVIGAVRRRQRLQGIVEAVGQAGALALTLLGLGLVHVKLSGSHAHTASYGWAFSFPLLVVCMAALRRTSGLAAAQSVDRLQRLPDLISSAWAFSSLPATARSPFMNAALAQAAVAARGIEPAGTFPIDWPRTLSVWPLLALGVLFAWQLPAAPAKRVPQALAAAPHELLLSAAEVAATRRELLRSPTRGVEAAELRSLNQAFERLFELVAERRIDRLQLLRALADLEARTLRASQHSAETLTTLRELGRSLANEHITKDLGAALADGDLRASRAAFERLAQRAETLLDRGELERLRAALRAGLSRQAAARERQTAQARRSLDTLEREARDARDTSQSGTQQRELEERLQRERASRERTRELDQLERELDQAARGGTQGGSQLARDLQSAAETVERMRASQEHDRGLQRLKERIEELRQRLAEHAAEPSPMAAEDSSSAAEQPLTLQEFQRRAQGKTASPSGERASASTEPGTSQMAAKSAPSALPKQLMAEGRSGEPEPAASDEGRPAHGPATQSGQADVDVAITGSLGKGPSRSAVIYDAAARGFGKQSYQKVHADYASHAESELEREPLPAGARIYVRRYFQLIQPREAAGAMHE